MPPPPLPFALLMLGPVAFFPPVLGLGVRGGWMDAYVIKTRLAFFSFNVAFSGHVFMTRPPAFNKDNNCPIVEELQDVPVF